MRPSARTPGTSGNPAIWRVGRLTMSKRSSTFGYLAVHRTAEVAKAVSRAYYGADAQYSYFVGCSRGGGQAMMEAQRYPKDFDGIIAGAPAFDWVSLAVEAVKNTQAV